MADRPGEERRIHVDSDWKEQAKREKERLADEAEEAAGRGPLPTPTLAEVINMVLMQAMLGLGGMQAPDGRAIPPDLEVAKHYIDLLALLQAKTKGNTTDDETRLIDAALYELRMRYVQAVSPPAAGGAPPPSR